MRDRETSQNPQHEWQGKGMDRCHQVRSPLTQFLFFYKNIIIIPLYLGSWMVMVGCELQTCSPGNLGMSKWSLNQQLIVALWAGRQCLNLWSELKYHTWYVLLKLKRKRQCHSAAALINAAFSRMFDMPHLVLKPKASTKSSRVQSVFQRLDFGSHFAANKSINSNHNHIAGHTWSECNFNLPQFC